MNFRNILSQLTCYAALAVAATTAPAVTVTPETAGAVAVRQNPSLAAARLRIAEAEGRLRNAGRFANPEIGAAYRQNFRTPERTGELSVTQKFPLTARLRLERAVSQAELAAARAEVANEERKIAAQARAATVRVLATEAQRKLRATQLENSREISEFTRKQLAVAQASGLEATLTELDAAQLDSERVALEVERAAALGELRPLLGLAPNQGVEVSGTLAPPASATPTTRGVAGRPDLIAARETAAAAQSGLELERARKWEDLSFTLSVESEYLEDAPEGLRRDEFVGFRFSLPLPLWNDRAGKIHEAAALARRRALEAEAVSLTASNEASTAAREMEALARVLRNLSDDLLPKASRLEELARGAHAGGQTPLTEVLRVRDRRFQLERQRIDALREYHLARIRYETATARPLNHSSGK